MPELHCSIVEEYKDVFVEPCALSLYTIKHYIDLINKNAPPIYLRQCRMSLSELADVCCQLDDKLARGWIKPSCSPSGHPILFVRRKASRLLMCVDCHLFNNDTRLDRYLNLLVDELLNRLIKAKYFSKSDVANAYH